jgi:hypothetical protein
LTSVVEWFASSRVLIVAGKGGVGKTTVGASVGLAASRLGFDVLMVELAGSSRLGRLFGHPQLGYHDTELERTDSGGRLRARRITPGDALGEYFHSGGLGRLTSRLTRMGAVELMAMAAPGLGDLVVLGKIRQLEQNGEADLIVVDAPASGQARGMLMAPSGLAGTATTGPLRHQADLVLDLFADETRCQVVLVTIPEEGPVNEIVETGFALEDEVGVRLGPVVVNGCWTAIDGLEDALDARRRSPGAATEASAVAAEAARFRLDRVAAQTRQRQRLERELPLPQVLLPFLFTPSLGRFELDQLATALTLPLGADPSVALAPAARA